MLPSLELEDSFVNGTKGVMLIFLACTRVLANDPVPPAERDHLTRQLG